MTPAKTKIITLRQAVSWRRAQARKGKTVAFTNGCFDILHPGHVRILEGARKTADSLIVGLNSDASVRRLKGPARPVNSERDRALVLAALEAVDRVVIFGEDTPAEPLRALRPDVLAKGADYAHNQIAGREYAGKTARIRLVKGKSTSRIINRLAGRA
ncbi:MAG: adenylyltransferase/cytidyltransferase family protein [Elusimicrobiaceae bacterium]|nr:adenylyltransferase/cytidyltransferase family protein [Elusimicrobiaceae bacterium]